MNHAKWVRLRVRMHVEKSPAVWIAGKVYPPACYSYQEWYRGMYEDESGSFLNPVAACSFSSGQLDGICCMAHTSSSSGRAGIKGRLELWEEEP